jgi:recombinational DNA repair protein RecT
MSEALVQGEDAGFDEFVRERTRLMVAALPVDVPDADLRRAMAQMRVAFSSTRQPELVNCTPESIARAITMSALSGLFPGGVKPKVYLIPRKNWKLGNALEANWQIAAAGYQELAYRNGWDGEAVIVYTTDLFRWIEGDDPRVEHEPDLDAPQTWENFRHVYLRLFPIGKRTRESTKFLRLTKAQVEARRAMSEDDKRERKKAGDKSVWEAWPIEMIKKTIWAYAGARSAFPADERTQAAMAMDNANQGRAEMSLPGSESPRVIMVPQAKVIAPAPAGGPERAAGFFMPLAPREGKTQPDKDASGKPIPGTGKAWKLFRWRGEDGTEFGTFSTTMAAEVDKVIPEEGGPAILLFKREDRNGTINLMVEGVEPGGES